MLTHFLYFSVGILLLFASFIIIIKKRFIPFYFIAAHLTIMGLGIISRTVISTNRIVEYPHFYQLIVPFQFLYGPLYYFFLISLFRARYSIRLVDWIHLIPFLFVLSDYLPFFILNADQKIVLIIAGKNISSLGIPYTLYDILKIFSFLFYFVLVGWFYFNNIFNVSISDQHTTKFFHRWFAIDYLLKFIAIISYVYFYYVELQHFTLLYLLLSLDAILNSLIVLTHPILSKDINMRYDSGYFLNPNKALLSKLLSLKYLFSTSNDSQSILRRLVYMIKIQKKHLDSGYNLHRFANALHVTTDKLEFVVKESFHCSFSTYLDFMRLEFATKQLHEIDNEIDFTFLKLAYNSGFRSIVTFYHAIQEFDAYAKKELFEIDKSSFHSLYNKVVNYI